MRSSSPRSSAAGIPRRCRRGGRRRCRRGAACTPTGCAQAASSGTAITAPSRARRQRIRGAPCSLRPRAGSSPFSAPPQTARGTGDAGVAVDEPALLEGGGDPHGVAAALGRGEPVRAVNPVLGAGELGDRAVPRLPGADPAAGADLNGAAGASAGGGPHGRACRRWRTEWRRRSASRGCGCRGPGRGWERGRRG
jgi:hypothetical protein